MVYELTISHVDVGDFLSVTIISVNNFKYTIRNNLSGWYFTITKKWVSQGRV